MQRGEVWVANLSPNKGGEAGKIRPVIIFQENRLTAVGLPTVIVVPLTTQLRKGLESLRVAIPAHDRLSRHCHAMPEQIRSLDRTRIDDGPLTKLSADELLSLERRLIGVLGML